MIWNWIRSCSLKEILHMYLLHFYWGILMMFGLSAARHSPRGRPSNRLTFTMTPTSLRLKRVKTKVNTSLIDWLVEINCIFKDILWIVKNASTVIHLHISSYAYMHQQVLFYSNNLDFFCLLVFFTSFQKPSSQIKPNIFFNHHLTARMVTLSLTHWFNHVTDFYFKHYRVTLENCDLETWPDQHLKNLTNFDISDHFYNFLQSIRF